jgi:hypothetical protein
MCVGGVWGELKLRCLDSLPLSAVAKAPANFPRIENVSHASNSRYLMSAGHLALGICDTPLGYW